MNLDEGLAEPASMIRFLKPSGRNIEVVDLSDFLNVFAAEVTISGKYKRHFAGGSGTGPQQ